MTMAALWLTFGRLQRGKYRTAHGFVFAYPRCLYGALILSTAAKLEFRPYPDYLQFRRVLLRLA